MSEDWAAIAAEVGDALAEVGQSAHIRRKGAATGPAYAPTYGPDTLHSCSVWPGHFKAIDRMDTSIAATDIKVTASALDIEPTAADILVIAGKDYEIVYAKPTGPIGDAVVWEIAARK